MYRHGHIGLSLLAGAPLATIAGLTFGPHWAIIIFSSSFLAAQIPDVDQRIPIVSHRGITHTLLFATILSLTFSLLLTYILAIPRTPNLQPGPLEILVNNPTTLFLAFCGFMIGFASHLFGDIITEAYDYTINPFWPFSSKAITLGWTTAGSRPWNWGFWLLGVVSAFVTFALLGGLN